MKLTEEQKAKRMASRRRNIEKERLREQASVKFNEMYDDELFEFADNPRDATKIEIEAAINQLEERRAENGDYSCAIKDLEDRLAELKEEEEELIYALQASAEEDDGDDDESNK